MLDAHQHPPNAIRHERDLQDIILLDLTVVIWHLDDNLFYEKKPLRIVTLPAGRYVHFDSSARYLVDLNIIDPSVTRPRWKYTEYVFSTIEDARNVYWEFSHEHNCNIYGLKR